MRQPLPSTWKIVPRWVTAVLVAALALVAPPPSAAAADPVRLEVEIGSACVLLRAAPERAFVVTIRTPGGRLRGAVTGRTGKAGRAFGCFGAGLEAVNGGDRIRAVVDGRVRRWTVPRLRMVIDRAADTIVGSATAGSTVALRVLPATSGRAPLSRSVSVGRGGSFRLDLAGAVDLRGRDTIMATTAADDLRTGARATVPFLLLTAASDVVVAVGIPRSVTRLALRRHGRVRATAMASDLGEGTVVVALRGRDGGRAYPRGGDRVTTNIPGVGPLRIPSARLRGDAISDVIHGRCMPGARYRLVVDGPRGRRTVLTGRTDPDGRLRRHPRLDLRRGDLLRLECVYREGDLLRVAGVVT